MKVLRSSLIVAAAVFTAACGDKVNVQGPTTAVPIVHSVTVAPATATLTNGASVTLTAAVTADPGAATTPVVWSSSSSVASVTQGGVVTAAAAPAAGSVGICAAVGGATGCATILVTASGGGGGGTTPASLQIQSITAAGGLNFPVPVPPGIVGTANAVVGAQLDVRLNLTANSTTPDSVVVFVDGVSTAKQTFSAAQASVIVATRDGIDAQVTPFNLVISINIAACKTATSNQATCGAATSTPSWLNGTHAISAKVFGKFTGTSTATSSTAGQSVSLLFGNTSGFIGTVTYTLGTGQVASMVDATGFGWKAGGITVSATPVIYSTIAGTTTQETVTGARLTFNNIGCSPFSTGPKFVALALVGTAWTGTLPVTGSGPAGVAAAGDVSDYEFTPGAATCQVGAVNRGGEMPVITATGSDNNNLFLAGAPTGGTDGAGFLNALGGTLLPDPNLIVRLDNVSPDGGVLVACGAGGTTTCSAFATALTATMTPNLRTGNWFNDAVVLNGIHATDPAVAGYVIAGLGTANGLLLSGIDNGSGRAATEADIIIEARCDLASASSSAVDANPPITSTTSGCSPALPGPLAESATGSTYRLRIRVKDKLGNTRNLSAGNFGVDRTAPTIALVAGGPAVNGQYVASGAVPANYSFSVSDPSTPPAAPSGFFNIGTTPLTVQQMRRTSTTLTQATTTTFLCPTGPLYVTSQANGGACATWLLTGQTYSGGLTINSLGTGTTNAYYAIWGTVQDQAGNVSTPATNVFVLDAVAPIVTGVSFPPILTGGGTNTFSAGATDNLDLLNGFLTLNYSAMALGTYTFIQLPTAINTFPTEAVGPPAPSSLTGGVVTNTTVSAPLSYFIRSLEQVTAGTSVINAAATVASTLPASVVATITDAAGNITASAPSAINAGSVYPTGNPAAPRFTVATATTDPSNANQFGVGGTWIVTAPAAPITINRASAAPTSVALTAVASGNTGTFINQCSAGVDFYGAAGGAFALRFLGSTGQATTVTDAGAGALGRQYTFNFTWTPGTTAIPDGPVDIYALCKQAAGDVLMTLKNVQITLAP